MLKPDGFLFINDYELVPVSVYIGDKKYPADITEKIAEITQGFALIKATEVAVGLGEIRASNMVLMGSLSKFLPIKLNSWKKALEELIPERVLELNINAFEKGREIVK
jgi:indolepyruvate ferredoxin oxidoreductase beta subunit